VFDVEVHCEYADTSNKVIKKAALIFIMIGILIIIYEFKFRVNPHKKSFKKNVDLSILNYCISIFWYIFER